jgi:hypothetical protein
MFLHNFIDGRTGEEMQDLLNAYKKLLMDYSSLTQKYFQQITNACMVNNIPEALKSYTLYLDEWRNLLYEALRLNLDIADGSMAHIHRTCSAFQEIHHRTLQAMPQIKEIERLMEKNGFIVKKEYAPLAFSSRLAILFGRSHSPDERTLKDTSSRQDDVSFKDTPAIQTDTPPIQKDISLAHKSTQQKYTTCTNRFITCTKRFSTGTKKHTTYTKKPIACTIACTGVTCRHITCTDIISTGIRDRDIAYQRCIACQNTGRSLQSNIDLLREKNHDVENKKGARQ